MLLLQGDQRGAQHAHLAPLTAQARTRSTQLLQQLLKDCFCTQATPCSTQRHHELAIQQHLICECISATISFKCTSSTSGSCLLLVNCGCERGGCCCCWLRAAVASKRVQAAVAQALHMLVVPVLQLLLLLLPLLHVTHHRRAVRRRLL
jgi:uncharacterized membrane protein